MTRAWRWLVRANSLAAIVRYAGFGLAFAGTVLWARILTAHQLAHFLLVVALVSAGATICRLGLPLSVVRGVSQLEAQGEPDAARRLSTTALQLSLIFPMVVAIPIACGVLWRVPTLERLTGLSEATSLALALWFVAESARGVACQIHLARERYLRAALISDPGRYACMVVSSAICILSPASDRFGALVLANALTVTALLLWALVDLGGAPLSRLHVADVRALVASSVTLLIINASGMVVSQLDVWVVGATSSALQTTGYGIASRLQVMLGTPLSVTNGFITPRFARYHSNDERQELIKEARSAAGVAFSATLLGFVVIAAIGHSLLTIVYGNSARHAYFAVLLLGSAEVISALVGPCGVLLVMTGHASTVARITVLTTIATIAAAFPAGTAGGATGVAASIAAGGIVQNAANWFAVRRTLGFSVWPVVKWPAGLRRQEADGVSQL